MAGAYTSPGPFTHGVWLVRLANGSAGIYQRNQLPAPDGVIQYYWIGASKKQIQSRFQDALSALGVTEQALNSGGLTGGKFGPSGTIDGLVPGSVSSAITSVDDFLSFIAWIFHPRNILRAVEFLTGITLMGFGLWAAIQHRGERREGFSTGESAISRSGLGRVANELASSEPRRAAPHRTRRIARERGRESAAYGRPKKAAPKKKSKVKKAAKLVLK